MTEKRFRMETIGDVMLPFIVDNSTAKKKSDTTTAYHTYETHRKEKCLELVDLLNDFSEENEKLKKSVNNLQDTIVTIGIAYQKKHGRTLVDLVDGTLEEDIIDLGTDL